MSEKLDAKEAFGATVDRAADVAESLQAKGRYTAICIGPDGKEKWREDFNNLFTTQGKNDILNQYFGGTAPASFFVGLISSVSYTAVAAGDTAAQINGSNQWKEGAASNAPNYSQGTRPALTLAAASAGSRATSAASVFSISGAGTVKGCFVITNSTKEGTTGVLVTAGLFTGGDKVVSGGDTLNVSWTGSL